MHESLYISRELPLNHEALPSGDSSVDQPVRARDARLERQAAALLLGKLTFWSGALTLVLTLFPVLAVLGGRDRRSPGDLE